MAAKKLKILFVTSEVVPFVKTGGLADVSSALPQMLSELGHEVRIVVPKYGAVDERKFKIHEIVRLKDLQVKIGDKDVIFSLKSCFLPGPRVRVQIYFLDNQEYFGSRNSLYLDPKTGKDYPDNDERFILLSRAVMELIIKLGWIPDVIHLNDWQCGLIPAYLKTIYKDHESFDTFKTLFTIHNLAYQGEFPVTTFQKTGLPKELESASKGIVHNGKINFMKSGLMFADVINTVSQTYANEIRTKEEYGEGLKEVLSKRKDSLFGIVNGIDKNVWNPEKDKLIPFKYSLKNIETKLENKKELADRFGLKFKEDVPIIGLISRLFNSKGMDLLQKAFPDLMKLNIQFIVLGTGDPKYHSFFEKMAMKYSDKFALYVGFNDELAHLIEAGSDIFLMPSKYEPCGLNQMYSLAYGTVPIVRETGGLADTVTKYNDKTEEGTGFVFKKYDSAEMLKEIKRAVKIFTDKKVWQKIMRNGMKLDFSWDVSAKQYIELYKTMITSD
ncbi:MAG: starch synthase [Ignavibacteriales bacterium UTCHB2]|jgi:starch synthase|nr:MAG: Glycogen synthase [Ignavibacteria bacterium ADurb.Bin266]OQY75309.1 MAG: starch synthase [Ignavibacteriales bacterium UTCHB2]HQI41582.1 glycogen synthase GlgA [Ignavibacteriaceae bacterium]